MKEYNVELFNTLRNKESLMRQEFRKLFDEYHVPLNRKNKIMSLSRKISTLQNLKENLKK